MIKKYQILSSGIDSLDVSIDVKWQNELFFEYLAEEKSEAQSANEDKIIIFPGTEQLALLKPYGRKGHEWIVEHENFKLTIGNWLEPKSRPSVMASIPSLALWNSGAQQVISQIRSFIVMAGGEVLSIKPSRVDLCMDIVLPSALWNVNLIGLRVTRATYAAPHFYNSTLTGISIGKGKIAARLYDKPLEIKQKSKKFWMYDIWGVEQKIPEEFRIIRIEGQVRREGLKELGLNHIDETFSHIEKIWAYLTQEWLKFQSNPGKHHTMRKTLDWWKVAQNSFFGVQQPTPLIRCKAFSLRKKQLYAQTHGTLTSILALQQEIDSVPLGSTAGLDDMQKQLKTCFKEYGKSDFGLEVEVLEKRAKNYTARDKVARVHQERQEKGIPSNLHPEAMPGRGEGGSWKSI